MVFKKKNVLKVEVTRVKAWLVAKGFGQKKVNYNEVFCSIVKHNSISLLLAIVAKFNLELEQLNVKIAFFHGELEKKST